MTVNVASHSTWIDLGVGPLRGIRMNVEVSEMNFFLCASILYKILDNISSQKIYIAIEKCNFHRKCIVSLFYCLTHCSIKCFRFMSGGGFFHKTAYFYSKINIFYWETSRYSFLCNCNKTEKNHRSINVTRCIL